MQELYYSAQSSSLKLLRDNNTSVQWNYVSSLIVCSSLYEIVAFSGSEKLVAFPIEGTNLYYNDNLIEPLKPISAPTIPVTYSRIDIRFELTNVDSANTASCYYYISSSAYYITGSGFSNQTGLAIAPELDYAIGVTGSGDYTATLILYDTTEKGPIPEVPGTLYANITASNSEAATLQYLSQSHNYFAYLQIAGTNLP